MQAAKRCFLRKSKSIGGYFSLPKVLRRFVSNVIRYKDNAKVFLCRRRLSCDLNCDLNCDFGCDFGCELSCNLSCDFGCDFGCELSYDFGCELSCCEAKLYQRKLF